MKMKMSSSPAEIVANIEELLIHILVRVPALSLIRFKCVSKHWLSLISDPDFRRRHTFHNPNSKILAFFSSKTQHYSFKSLPLEITPRSLNPFETLNKLEPNLRILQSCNGLFLCHTSVPKKHHPIYVVNPTTNQFRTLSPPSLLEKYMNRYAFVRYGLAFDPSKSPHYKVVCVSNNYPVYDKTDRHEIDLYSSETAEWKNLEAPFFPRPSDEGRHHNLVKKAMHFNHRSSEGAVYCNGAVHWISFDAALPFCSIQDRRFEFVRNKLAFVMHYFDMSEERLRAVAATPPVPLVVQNIPLIRNARYVLKFPTIWPRLSQIYFGECGGRLCLTETYQHCMTQFDVMEMEMDYSGWFVKYHIDLNPLVAVLPGECWNDLYVLGLSQAEEKDNGADQDCSTNLLLHLPGKFISYNLRNMRTFKASPLKIRDVVSFPYLETLACL